MKILITGGNGFIGSKIVEILCNKHKITILDNDETYGLVKEQQLKNLLIWRKRRWKKISTEIKGDIRESLVGIKAFKSRPDMVIHLASYPRAKIIQSNPVEGISQVVDGTVNMLWHAAKFGVKKFVYVSSSMVYGHFKDGTKENAKTKPINMYGEAKLTGERLTKLWCTNNNLDYAIVRPSGVYGPGDLPDRVISKFFDAAMTNQDLQVHGNNKVDFTYRKDAAQGIIDVAFSEHKNTSFNITAGKSHTLKETAKLIVKICKSKSKIVDPGAKSLYPLRGTLDIKRAKKYCGYKPTINLEQGLKNYYEWLQNKI